MGHRFSKSATTCYSDGIGNNFLSSTNKSLNQIAIAEQQQQQQKTNRISIPPLVGPTINLQIEESPTASSNILPQLSSSSSSSLTSINNCPRQIIIKIQLAKMENGNEQQPQHEASSSSSDAFEHVADLSLANAPTVQQQHHQQQLEANAQIVNVTLNRNFLCDSGGVNVNNRTAGSSLTMNTNFNGNLAVAVGKENELANSTLNNDNETVEYCEVLENAAAITTDADWENTEHTCATETTLMHSNECCRRQKSAKSSTATATSNSKRRCCKCTCRDAFRRILEPSSKTSKSKERKEQKQHSNHTEKVLTPNAALAATTLQQRQQINNNFTTNASISHASVAVATTTVAASAPAAVVATASNSQTTTNQLSLWATAPIASNDVLLPRFFVLQCQCPTSLMISQDIPCVKNNNNAVAASSATTCTNSISNNTNRANITKTTNAMQPTAGPIVHSQVDFVHFLVPDLERITNSSFYWGKMDRYEAERLLEGKPEGTFLLRDSAQEEFLFSVTFRKYGRSLHARIEQSGHKFSFDCHDPCVFTASTVTGLLEHYKDPACVMFFEPMLTIPLHRKTTFSLQQLSRATIVSNITYDGINELELPARLKSYLKEYHYKQKLRVKPFDEPFYYSCT